MAHYTEVVGYSYDAGYHCLDCAELKFNSDSKRCAIPEGGNVYLSELIDLPEDSEGNPLHPIFAGELDENDEGEIACEDCGAML